MKALHVASFSGNIGDCANNAGFWHCFSQYVTEDVHVTRDEIRDYYRSRQVRAFDDEFAKRCNEHDLLVIGGGNFFEFIWDYSCTGTTINISDAVLDQIRVPILINGMGVDDRNQTASAENIRKFTRFITKLIERPRTLVTVRNDGSYEILRRYLAPELCARVLEVPDGGFFTVAKPYYHPELRHGHVNIAVNLACDREAERWPADSVTKEQFLLGLRDGLVKVLREHAQAQIVFVPHIYSDVKIINELITMLPDTYVRENVCIAPYLSGENLDYDYILDLYRQATLTIGMRYHSNIVSIGMGTPTIGVVNILKHKLLYRKIGLAHRMLPQEAEDYPTKLAARVSDILANPDRLARETRATMAALTRANELYFEQVKRTLGAR